MDSLYREIILEHWKNPQNYGVLDHADVDLTESNPLCGDEIRITVRLSPPRHSHEDGNLTISECNFTGQGCAISMAAASILTEVVAGQSVADIQTLTQEAFLKNLDVQLTPARLKCALLPYSTLQKGLSDSKGCHAERT